MNQFRNKRFLVTSLAVVFVLIFGIFLLQKITGTGAVNPNKDRYRTAEEGRDYAALYMQGSLYTAVDENENVMSQVRNDIMTFARSTRAEFANKDTLVGFTFDEESSKEGDTYIYTGHYYGLRDKIQIKLTPHERGVYTLSITNLKDQTNIDDELSMNGKRNRYITTLPVEKPNYSIRYQLTQDRIVVSFYDGYTAQDVDEAVTSLTNGLGDELDENAVYNINRIGIVSLAKVRDNLVNPIPTP